MAIVLIAAGAIPVMAQTTCMAPAAPAAIDAAKATGEQVRRALAAAQNFMAESDTYQNCLTRDLDTQKATASKDAPFDPAVEKDIQGKVQANQTMRQQVADATSNIISTFKKSHACDLASCK